jgi:hypothetical protein
MSRTLVTLIACGVAMTSLGTAAHAQYYGMRYYGPGYYDRGYDDDQPRYYRQYPRGYRQGDVYDRGHPYSYNYDYGDPRCGRPNFTIQDGVCKPYTGR